LIPPTVFLLACGITRQLTRTRDGVAAQRWMDHTKAAMRSLKQGDAKAAVAELEKAEQSEIDMPQAHQQLARAYQQAGKEDKSLEHSERSLRLRPNNGGEFKGMWISLVQNNIRIGRVDIAERMLREDIFPRWPDLPDAHYYQGMIALRRDSSEAGYRRALASFEAALKLDPKHAGARKSYGDCQARLGNPADAEKAYRAAIDINSQDRGAIKELSAVLRQQGKNDEAKRVLARLEALGEKQRRLRHLQAKVALGQPTHQEILELGQRCLELERFQEAEQSLFVYTKQEPADPAGHRALAEVYRRTNHPKDAESSLKLADALDSKRGGRR
jgi:Tfp pilus assembly protein PilF